MLNALCTTCKQQQPQQQQQQQQQQQSHGQTDADIKPQ